MVNQEVYLWRTLVDIPLIRPSGVPWRRISSLDSRRQCQGPVTKPLVMLQHRLEPLVDVTQRRQIRLTNKETHSKQKMETSNTGICWNVLRVLNFFGVLIIMFQCWWSLLKLLAIRVKIQATFSRWAPKRGWPKHSYELCSIHIPKNTNATNMFLTHAFYQS